MYWILLQTLGIWKERQLIPTEKKSIGDIFFKKYKEFQIVPLMFYPSKVTNSMDTNFC